MKIKRDEEKEQEKTKVSNYLCTKGVIYSNNLGRVSKSLNKHILTLRGKDLFRNPTKVNGCIDKFVLRFISPPQVVKKEEQTNFTNKVREKKCELSTINPSTVFNNINIPYVENPFKIILKQHKATIATNKNVPTYKRLCHSIDMRCISLRSHILLEVSFLGLLIQLLTSFGVSCRMIFDPGGK